MPPHLNRLQNRGGSAKEPLRDPGETLGRVCYVKVVQVVADLSYPIRVWCSGTRESSNFQEGLYLVRRGVARINQRNISAYCIAYYAAQDGVVGATQNKCAQVAFPQVSQINAQLLNGPPPSRPNLLQQARQKEDRPARLLSPPDQGSKSTDGKLRSAPLLPSR